MRPRRIPAALSKTFGRLRAAYANRLYARLGLAITLFLGVLTVRSDAGDASARPSRDVVLDTPRLGLRVTFESAGVTLDSHDRHSRAVLAWRHAGRFGRETSASGTLPVLRGNRVEYDRGGGIVDWYVSDHRGLEHGVTFLERPTGDGPLVVELGVGGDAHAISAGDESAALVSAAGETLFRYGELMAKDASGRRLHARLAIESAMLRLIVDDQDATYPVVIDPLVWREKAELNASDASVDSQFGQAIAVDGTTAVIGSSLVQGGRGAVYVFSRTGETWTQTARLEASDASRTTRFGSVVALRGDTLVVGAYENRKAASAYVFELHEGSWTQTQILQASDTTPYDAFGCALSLDEDVLVIGAKDRLLGSGAAYIFRKTGETWIEEQRLWIEGSEASAEFGASVAVRGRTLMVGRPFAFNAEENGAVGEVNVYERSLTTWLPRTTLKPSIRGVGHMFGFSLALDSTRLLVGTLIGGHVFSFRPEGPNWKEDQVLQPTPNARDTWFGMAVAMRGAFALVGAPEEGTGSAYLFEDTGTAWVQRQKLTPSTPSTQPLVFGRALAFDDHHALIGAPRKSADTGAAYSFLYALSEGDACSNASMCASGYCVDGVCCDTACGDGKDDCQTCNQGAAGASKGICSPLPSGFVCRRAAGSCDVADTCDGLSSMCPADLVLPNGTVCEGTSVCASGKCVAANGNASPPAREDAAPPEPGEPSGCGCKIGRGTASTSLAALALLVLGIMGRRCRRASPTSALKTTLRR